MVLGEVLVFLYLISLYNLPGFHHNQALENPAINRYAMSIANYRQGNTAKVFPIKYIS